MLIEQSLLCSHSLMLLVNPIENVEFSDYAIIIYTGQGDGPYLLET